MRKQHLRWIYAILLTLGLAVACSPSPRADTNGPDGVRVQTIPNPMNPVHGECAVFTHDTAQGASIAVVCR